MLHSVIIPHEKRERTLKLCLDRLQKASRSASGRIEVLVICESQIELSDVLPPSQWGLPIDFKFHTVGREGYWFNKPRLQNIGIEKAWGVILTFLDADSLVGERFFEGAEFALSPRLTKVCYRVAPLGAAALEKAESDPEYIDRCFDGFDTFAPFRFEAHQLPNLPINIGLPVFGNSQFSITREKLGDVRPDERFEGAGFEDISFNKAIWEAHGAKYHACLMTDADHAIMDIEVPRDPTWYTTEQHANNGNLFNASCSWLNQPSEDCPELKWSPQ